MAPFFFGLNMDKEKKWKATIYCDFDMKTGAHLLKERVFEIEYFNSKKQAKVWILKSIVRLEDDHLNQDEWEPLFDYYLQKAN